MESCTTARVVKIVGRRAEVVVDRQEACGSCQTADLCQAFGQRGETKAMVDNLVGAQVGQEVEIASARDLGLRAAAMVYLVPAAFFVGGVVVGSEVLHWTPLASGLLGVGAMGISWLLAKAYDRRAQGNADFRLSITRIISR